MFLRLCGAGFTFLMAACVGGPSPSLPGLRWVLAGVQRVAVALSHRFGCVSSPPRACGGSLGLEPRLVSLDLVLWRALVRCTVSSRALPCCAVLVCALSRCALLCCAVPRCVVPWSVVPWRGWLCRAVPRRSPVVVCRVVGCFIVVRCTAVRCGAVCRVASCCAMYRCAVVCGGPF